MPLRQFILFCFLFTSCNRPGTVQPDFDFEHPSEVIKLPGKLREISGITFTSKNELACVQDEKGVVYFYDVKKDKLRSELQFAKDHDYEAITNVNDTLYVLCSNGDISEIDPEMKAGESTRHSTFLSKQNNVEGLCYDEKARRLLLACKGRPQKGTADRSMKAVYAYDLKTNSLLREPVYIIDPDSVLVHLDNKPGFWSRLFRAAPAQKEFLFEPSEICIDPVSSEVYVLSSVGKTILCLNYDGTIKYACHLNPEIFKQPEGIAFARKGLMYISDEGKSGHANLISIRRVR